LFAINGWAAQSYVLDDVRLIDGLGKPSQEHMRVVVDGQYISAVGPASFVAIPKDGEVKNYVGKSVLPGLISDHVHLAQYQAATPYPDAYTRETAPDVSN
jgi:imidazolonepropionase-like amidohydrolase